MSKQEQEVKPDNIYIVVARMDENISFIKEKMDTFVTKSEIAPLKIVVYSITSIFGLGLIEKIRDFFIK